MSSSRSALRQHRWRRQGDTSPFRPAGARPPASGHRRSLYRTVAGPEAAFVCSEQSRQPIIALPHAPTRRSRGQKTAASLNCMPFSSALTARARDGVARPVSTPRDSERPTEKAAAGRGAPARRVDSAGPSRRPAEYEGGNLCLPRVYGSGGCCLFEVRDDFLAHELDRLHHFLVRDAAHLHHQD